MADVSCPICGRPNGDHREFCDFCGNPLDGALRIENDQSPLGADPSGSQEIEYHDEESRLDSLLSPPEEETQPSRLDDFQSSEPLNGDARLDSLLSPPEETQGPAPENAGPSDPLPPESRLDDYLPVDKISQESEPEFSESEDDGSTRLGAYLTPEQAAEALPLDLNSLSDDQENGSSRLDDYLPPESPPEPKKPEESSLLDDFLGEDPFRSPDPFQDPDSSAAEEQDPFNLELSPFEEPPAEENLVPPPEPEPSDPLAFSRDSFLEDSPQQTIAEEPEAESQPPQEDPTSEPEGSSPWDFLKPSPEPSQSPGSLDPEVWDFLDPKPDPEQPQAESSPESSGLETWNFLDPAPEPGQTQPGRSSQSPDSETSDLPHTAPSSELTQEDQSLDSADPEQWDFLDATIPPQDSDAPAPPQAIDAGEWDYLDPGSAGDQLDAEAPAEPVNGGEWDFLDPAPEAALEDEGSPAGESGTPPTPDDWSFLDPGPVDDSAADADARAFPGEESGEDAGWLDMLQDPESRPKIELEFDPLQEPQKPQTDWLEKIKRLNQSADMVDEDSSFPDWLSVTGKTAEFPSEGSTGAEAADDVPDWLRLDDDESLNEFLRRKDLTNEEYKPKITTDSLDSDEVPADGDGPGSEPSESQHIKFPSWAEEDKKKGQKPPVVEGQVDAKPADTLPSQPFQMEEEFFDDLFSEELPGWLTSSSSREAEQTFGQNLAQGELPGWVEAMRPVVESSDASGLDDDEDYIENYGPLAGIPSVLPAEAEIGIDLDQAAQKPLDLLATKKHNDYVELLKRLIGEEDKSVTITARPRMQTQRVLRWMIAILMVVSIAVSVIFNGPLEADSLSASQLAGTGFSALYDEIETLYDGQPVMVAYDYQPAAAGEMQIAAATVVDHLMEQGTYLTLISTQPTGPALAEHFLKTTQSHHQYKHTQKYINLGFLPGESAGLLSFTIAPQKIIPLAFDGSNAWDSPPLISVDEINDFKMIVVITDDPNTAKNWIEQVGSRLDKTPLVMVVSAQVEPLIQPYFRTSPRQVSGYVAGIIDSMNYEQLSARPYLASKAWLPFNIGIVISVGIIFISGLANGVLTLFKRRKDFLTGETL